MAMRSRLCAITTRTWKKWRSKLPPRRLAKIYLVVFISTFATSFSATMLLSYLPFMTVFLIPSLQDDDRAVGKYAGYIAGSLAFGRIFGCYLWGVIADSKGRKPVMIITTLSGAVFMLMFGFSVNYPMAIVTRILYGFTNGMISTCKAMVSESSDDSNQPLGVAVIGVAWGAGYIVGPAISGAIADPIGQYNLNITNPFLHSFLTKFPYSPPPLVNFVVFVISLVTIFLLLPETLGSKKNKAKSEVDVIDEDIECEEPGNGIASPHQSEELNQVSKEREEVEEEREEEREEEEEEEREEEEREEEEREEEEEEEEEVEGEETQPILTSTKISRHSRSFLTSLKNAFLNLRIYFCNGTPLKSLVIFTLHSFATFCYYEVYSLWAFTSPHLGGLGFSLQEIGTSLTIVAVLVLPIVSFCFPWLEKRLHSIKTYYLSTTVLIVLIPLIPNVHYLVPKNQTGALWFVLITISFLINMSFSVGFSAVSLFMNNSVSFEKLASINGIGMATSSIARTIGPIALGSLFSVSLSDATLDFGFPVNYNLVFVLLSISFLITVFMVAYLPVSINKQKIIKDG